MSTSKATLVVSLLATVALLASGLLYSLRCQASPPVSMNALSVAVVVQCIALAFVHRSLVESQESSPVKLTRFLLWSGVGLFLASLLLARYAIVYSDAIGHPNWYKSVGLQCSRL